MNTKVAACRNTYNRHGNEQHIVDLTRPFWVNKAGYAICEACAETEKDTELYAVTKEGQDVNLTARWDWALQLARGMKYVIVPLHYDTEAERKEVDRLANRIREVGEDAAWEEYRLGEKAV
jgi:hypothetical protein